MTVQKHIQEHAAMRYPKVDANGNLLADVTPRVGTLTDLLLIANAGIGEIATASDEDCVVVYKDDGAGGSIGVPHFRNGQALTGYMESETSVPSGVVTPLTVKIGELSSSAPAGLVDSTNHYLNVPSYIYNDSNIQGLIPVILGFGGYLFSAGANVTVGLELYDGTAWTDIDNGNSNKTFVVDGSGLLDARSVINIFESNTSIAQRLRFTFLNDGAATGTIVGGGAFGILKTDMA